MRYSLCLLITMSFMVIQLRAQDMPEDRQIREGNSTSGGRQLRSLHFYYYGNIDKLISDLSVELKKPLREDDRDTFHKFTFTRILKPEWSSLKLTMTFVCFSNGDRHSIGVTCVDAKKFDAMVPYSESQKQIKAYLKTVLGY